MLTFTAIYIQCKEEMLCSDTLLMACFAPCCMRYLIQPYTHTYRSIPCDNHYPRNSSPYENRRWKNVDKLLGNVNKGHCKNVEKLLKKMLTSCWKLAIDFSLKSYWQLQYWQNVYLLLRNCWLPYWRVVEKMLNDNTEKSLSHCWRNIVGKLLLYCCKRFP